MMWVSYWVFAVGLTIYNQAIDYDLNNAYDFNYIFFIIPIISAVINRAKTAMIYLLA